MRVECVYDFLKKNNRIRVVYLNDFPFRHFDEIKSDFGSFERLCEFLKKTKLILLPFFAKKKNNMHQNMHSCLKTVVDHSFPDMGTFEVMY